MDIFGKAPTGVKQRSPLQNELAAKLKDRNSKGYGADLTETEEEDDALASDDDLMAAFNIPKNKPQQRSQSPWRVDAKPEPPKPQARSSIGTKDSKQKIAIKPKNELDRLLADDYEQDDMLRTQKKPWQPPQFKDFSAKDEHNSFGRESQPRDGLSKQTPLVNPRRQSALVEENEEGSDDEELAGAYTKQLQQKRSPFARQTPVDRTGSVTPKDRHTPNSRSPLQQGDGRLSSGAGRSTPKSKEDLFGDKRAGSGRTTPITKEELVFGSGKTTPRTTEDGLSGAKKVGLGRTTPKKKEDDLFGSKSSKTNNNLDDIFGKRKSPTDQSLFSGKKSSEDRQRESPADQRLFSGKKSSEDKQRESPAGSKFQSKTQDGRHTPQNDLFGRKSPKPSSLDDVFGAKKRVESPLFKSTQREEATLKSGMSRDEVQSQKPQAPARKGTYMSSLLADSDDETVGREQKSQQPTRTSYLDNLLRDDTADDQSKIKPKARSSYMDSLLDDGESGHRSRPRQRSAIKDNKKDDEDERESSLCRDVDKDPMMIEKKKVEREEKKQSRKGKAQTESQQAEFDIEEVCDAQDSLAMTFIKTEQSSTSNRNTAVKKPKARKAIDDPETSAPTFESASDIRNYIYKEWMEKKQSSTKKTVAEKKKLEREAQLKKEKELLDKKLENEATFRTWKEQKDEQLKEKFRKMRTKEQNKEEELKKEEEKKRDAAMTFRKWKEDKDEDIIHKKKRGRKVEMSKLSETQEIEDRKKKDAAGAFNGWKKRKDKEIKHTMRQTKVIEKQEATQQMSETRRQEIEAEELYNRWLINKEKQKRHEKLKARSRQDLDNSPRPAWSPANKTIPCGR